jgi:hypothetical protein
MNLLKWLDRTLTSIFDIIFSLLILAAAAAGGFVAWHILGLMEQSMLIQIGGSLLVGLVTGAIAWVVLQFLKVTGG